MNISHSTSEALPFENTEFLSMGISELCQLYSFVTQIMNMSLSLQEAYVFGDDTRLNKGGEYLEKISMLFDNKRAAIIQAAKCYDPSNEHERRLQGNLILKYEAECGELDLTEMASLALSFAKVKH